MANSAIPIDAEKPRVLHALVQKRAELAGLIEHKRYELRRKTAELEHVDSTIRLFTEAVDLGAIRPKLIQRRAPAFKGEITSHIFDAMREADRPLMCREITALVISARGLDAGDPDLWQIILKRVRAALRAQKHRDILTAAPGPDGALQWKIAELGPASCAISDQRKATGRL